MDVTRRYLRKYALAGNTLNTPFATTPSNLPNITLTDDVPGKRDKDLGKDPEGNDVVQSKNGKVYRKKNGIWEEYPQEGEPYKEGDGAGPRGISGSYTIPSDGSSSSASGSKGNSFSPPPAPQPQPVPPPILPPQPVPEPTSDSAPKSNETKKQEQTGTPVSSSTNSSSTTNPNNKTKSEQSISKKEKREQRRRERRLAKDLDAVPAENQGKKQVSKPDTSQEQQIGNQQQENTSSNINNNTNNSTGNGVTKKEVTSTEKDNTGQVAQQQTQKTEENTNNNSNLSTEEEKRFKELRYKRSTNNYIPEEEEKEYHTLRIKRYKNRDEPYARDIVDDSEEYLNSLLTPRQLKRKERREARQNRREARKERRMSKTDETGIINQPEEGKSNEKTVNISTPDNVQNLSSVQVEVADNAVGENIQQTSNFGQIVEPGEERTEQSNFYFKEAMKSPMYRSLSKGFPINLFNKRKIDGAVQHIIKGGDIQEKNDPNYIRKGIFYNPGNVSEKWRIFKDDLTGKPKRQLNRMYRNYNRTMEKNNRRLDRNF